MNKLFCRKTISSFRKTVSLAVLVAFGLSIIAGPVTPASAQLLPNLPAPGQMVYLTSGFQPPVLRGMTVHPENPLLFDFIVDRGQDKIGDVVLKDESTKLIKYFLASMTIPDKDAWVNLSPYEKDRIVPDALGQTEMGRQMLEQDYVLKQLSASLTNLDKELGQKFWNEVRTRAQKQFGTTEIPLNTFNKVWIVPDGATVVEKDGFAYITESKLKVMLDEDYVALEKNPSTQPQDTKSQISKLSSDVFREMILPKLVEEVNTGKNFAQTRQVYQSVILAAWYKKALKDSLLGKIYADKSKVEGVESDVKDIKQKVYDQYLEAFKKGAYNFIKEEDNGEELIPRKYFSGGLDWDLTDNNKLRVDRAGSSVNAALAQVASSSLNGDFALVAAVGAESAEATARKERTVAATAVVTPSFQKTNRVVLVGGVNPDVTLTREEMIAGYNNGVLVRNGAGIGATYEITNKGVIGQIDRVLGIMETGAAEPIVVHKDGVEKKTSLDAAIIDIFDGFQVGPASFAGRKILGKHLLASFESGRGENIPQTQANSVAMRLLTQTITGRPVMFPQADSKSEEYYFKVDIIANARWKAQPVKEKTLARINAEVRTAYPDVKSIDAEFANIEIDLSGLDSISEAQFLQAYQFGTSTEYGRAHKILLEMAGQYASEQETRKEQQATAVAVNRFPSQPAGKLGREKLVAYLEALQRKGDGTGFHRTLKLVAAAVNNDSGILKQSGPMSEDKIRATLRSAGEFSLNNTDRLIQEAGRERDYEPINQALKELAQSAQPTTQPVETSNGTKLANYLTTLQSQGGTQSVAFQRTLKVIVATIHDNPNMLMLGQQQLITDDKVREAMQRLDEFSSEKAERIIKEAGRQDDYGPINRALKELSGPAEVANAKEQQPSRFTSQNARIPPAVARKKISDLRKLKAQINDGQLPEVLNFGDKHGKIEDLERILKYARQAAQEGRPLKIIGHGDGFDRGADNIKVLEIFQELKKIEAANPNISVKFLWGNHDVWLVQAILLNDEQAAAQWKAQGGQEVIDQFNNAGLDIKELALFMVKNFELFHVDEWGFMHVHAGIPMDENGKPRMAREQINQLAEQWKGMQAEIRAGPQFFADVRNQEQVAQFFKQAAPLFWVRGNAWHAKAVESRLDEQIQIDAANKERLFAILKQVINTQLQQQGVNLSQAQIAQEVERNWAQMLVQNEEIFLKAGVVFKILDRNPKVNKDILDNFLGQLEVNGIVVGHDHHNRLLNIDNRIFGIDVDDDDVGHLRMNGNGIEFNALARSSDDLVLGKADMLKHIDEQIQRLGKEVGEVVEETKPGEVTQTVVSQKAPARQEGQREIAFSKTRMHDLSQGFQVGWGEGLFEFKVRESTSQAGAARVWDIKIDNQSIPIVAGRDPQGRLVLGDSLLIEEGQQLEIGRDRIAKNYVFAVGGRTYAVAQYNNQFVLIRRPALQPENFNLSRSVQNRQDRLTVLTDSGATSRTMIQPFIMASNPQEALEILSKVFNRANYLSEASSSPLEAQTASAATVDEKPATNISAAAPGGIDFDPSKLNLQIKRDGRGVPLPLPQQNLENININGLYPVIINIMPINTQTLPILSQVNVKPDVALSKS